MMKRLVILEMRKWERTHRKYQRVKIRGKIKLRSEHQNEKLELKCKNLNRKKIYEKTKDFLYIFYAT